MSDPTPEEINKLHRRLAVDFYNVTWALIEKRNRTEDEDVEMIASTFASLVHWRKVGNAQNHAISDWQVSRVYAVLHKPADSMKFAKRALAICEANMVESWCTAFAHEAIARAAAIAGDEATAKKHLKIAVDIGNTVTDKEDRDILFKDLATVPGFPPSPLAGEGRGEG